MGESGVHVSKDMEHGILTIPFFYVSYINVLSHVTLSVSLHSHLAKKNGGEISSFAVKSNNSRPQPYCVSIVEELFSLPLLATHPHPNSQDQSPLLRQLQPGSNLTSASLYVEHTTSS